MECNAGFYNAFKDFVGMSYQPNSIAKSEKGFDLRKDNCNKESAMLGGANDLDLGEVYDGEPHSPNGSVYDSDYSDNGFPLPCASVVQNNNFNINNAHLINQGYRYEESSVEHSNTCNSYSSGHSDRNVMEGEIYINGEFENNPSFENAMASVVQEFEINSSNEDSGESNSLEAIFVPLKSISPDSTLNTSCALISPCDLQIGSYNIDCEMKTTNMPDGNNSLALLPNRNFFDNSPNKENFHSNMQSVSAHCVTEEGPKVVVEVAPSRDISLAEISALRNIDVDSESYRDDGTDTDKQYCEAETHYNVSMPQDRKNDQGKHSNGQPQTYASYSENKMAESQDQFELDLDFGIFKGRGVKLRYIPRIAEEIALASGDITQAIHNILYDVPGSCKNKNSRVLTKRNILNFSGFNFEEHSDLFEFKKLRISRIPSQTLCNISHIFLGVNIDKKSNILEELLSFLMKPTKDKCNGGEETETKIERKSKEETDDSHILSCLPRARRKCFVRLERMNNDDIHRKIKEASEGKYGDSQKQMVVATTQRPNNCNKNLRVRSSPYSKPSFILTGPGVKLRELPGVVKNLHSLTEKIVHILHVVFYGTTMGCDQSKYNILEFSGFPPCQDEWLVQRRMFMNMVRTHDIRLICRAFRLEPIDNNKNGLINCLLNFLKKPSADLMTSNRSGSRGRGRVSAEILRQRLKKTDVDIQPIIEPVEISDVRKGLKAFPRIRTNIECATPEDLLELHDVIFGRSCESYQIHKKILDFEGFSFNETSKEYQFRKTLMYYMSFQNIMKIATLLDLPGSDKHKYYHNDLCSSILKFLLKPSDATLGELNRVAGGMRFSKCDAPSTETFVQSHDHQHPKGEREQAHSSTPVITQGRLAANYTPETTCIPFNNQKKRPFSMCDNSRLHSNELVSYSTNHAVPDHMPPAAKKINICHSSSSEDESEIIPLAAFISHPSDSILKQDIQEIIEANVQSISMKGLIHTIYSKYPDFDLRYRANFIRSKARKVLSKMQRIAQGSANSPQNSISFPYNRQISYHNYDQPRNFRSDLDSKEMCYLSCTEV